MRRINQTRNQKPCLKFNKLKGKEGKFKNLAIQIKCPKLISKIKKLLKNLIKINKVLKEIKQEVNLP